MTRNYTSLLVLLLVNEMFLLAYSLLGLVYTLTSCKWYHCLECWDSQLGHRHPLLSPKLRYFDYTLLVWVTIPAVCGPVRGSICIWSWPTLIFCKVLSPRDYTCKSFSCKCSLMCNVNLLRYSFAMKGSNAILFTSFQVNIWFNYV